MQAEEIEKWQELAPRFFPLPPLLHKKDNHTAQAALGQATSAPAAAFSTACMPDASACNPPPPAHRNTCASESHQAKPCPTLGSITYTKLGQGPFARTVALCTKGHWVHSVLGLAHVSNKQAFRTIFPSSLSLSASMPDEPPPLLLCSVAKRTTETLAIC